MSHWTIREQEVLRDIIFSMDKTRSLLTLDVACPRIRDSSHNFFSRFRVFRFRVFMRVFRVRVFIRVFRVRVFIRVFRVWVFIGFFMLSKDSVVL